MSTIPQTESALTWAILAYCANGPDLLLSLAARRHGAAQVLTALEDFTHHVPKSADCAAVASAQITHLAQTACAACGLDFAKRFSHYETNLRAWVQRLRQCQALGSLNGIERFLTHDGRYRLISPGSPLWPCQIDDLPKRTGAPSPLCFWIDGDARILTQYRYAAIVGSRNSTAYGSQCAEHLASRLARHGIGIVSGGALGIDASAHEGCLRAAEAPTIAVFAGGLDHIGPASNLMLFDQIRSSGGALVSEAPPDTIPYASRFLERNRLIAALSDCIIVAQARWKSGALNTARWGAQMLRTTLAIPGPITEVGCAGCNRLIAENKASLLLSIEDIDSFIQPARLAVGDEPPYEPLQLRLDAQPAKRESSTKPRTNGNRQQRPENAANESSNGESRSDAESAMTNYLSQHRQTTIAALATAFSFTPIIRIKQVLGALELEGKITRTPDGGVRYVPRP